MANVHSKVHGTRLKQGTLTLLVLLVLATTATAQNELTNIELLKESYAPGETLQARITTTNPEKELAAQQIVFYVNNGKKPIAPFLVKLTKNNYLFYSDIPLGLEGNATLAIERIPYRINGILQEVTTQKEIILSNETAILLTVQPGFLVITKDLQEVQLTVESKKGTANINITVAEGITNIYQTLQPVQEGTKRLFKFPINQQNLAPDAFITMTYGARSYTVPVIVKPEATETTEEPAMQKKALEFVAAKSSINKTIAQSLWLNGTIALKNNLNITLQNITLIMTETLPSIMQIDTTVLPELQPQEARDIYIMINGAANARPGLYQGVLRAATEEHEAAFPVIIQVEQQKKGEDGEKINNDLNLSLSKRESEEQPKIDRKLEINLSRPQPVIREKELPIGLLIVTFFLILVALGFTLMRKKKGAREVSFEEYIRQIKK